MVIHHHHFFVFFDRVVVQCNLPDSNDRHAILMNCHLYASVDIDQWRMIERQLDADRQYIIQMTIHAVYHRSYCTIHVVVEYHHCNLSNTIQTCLIINITNRLPVTMHHISMYQRLQSWWWWWLLTKWLDMVVIDNCVPNPVSNLYRIQQLVHHRLICHHRLTIAPVRKWPDVVISHEFHMLSCTEMIIV